MHNPQISTKKRRWKKPVRQATAVLLCVVCLFIPRVFAQEINSTTLLSIQSGLQTLLSLASRGWIVLATLAGKLMTNDWVYGSALHMDIYLRKIWNIMKNFANFALAGVVLWSIIKGITGKEGIKVKDIITKTLLAGVLIQASWFLVGALVDLSTIAVSAVAAFPATFIQGNATLDGDIQAAQTKMQATTTIVDMVNGTITPIASQDTTPVSSTDALDSILPNSNSISGPLIYMGMSVFGFYDYLTMGDHSANIKDLTINFSLKAIVLVFYTLGLFLLFVANLIRVAFLWLFIIASPIIVLFSVFKSSGGESKGKGVMQYLNFSSLANMIFKPVIYIAALSLILIFIASIQNIMTGTPPSLNGVSMTMNGNSSTLAIQNVSSVEITDNIFSSTTNTAKNIFADLITFLLAIFLTWELVKLSFTGTGPVEAITGQLAKGMEQYAATRPLIGGLSAAGLKGAVKGISGKVAEGVGVNRAGEFYKNTEAYRGKLEKLRGMNLSRNDDDYKRLNKTIKPGGANFFSEAKSIGRDKNGVTLSDQRIQVTLDKWLKRNHTTITDDGTNISSAPYTDTTDFETFFGGKEGTDTPAAQKNRWILHYLMGGNDNDIRPDKWSAINPPKYTDLINNIYYRPPTAK